ncbi:hypothetical protein [Rodentibacter caecimuris]|uniref:hypothetical protein n=1 Tax=Rodentibacter caecimuris TaxID=1796644 RepID=UPI000B24AA5C|nr:hypothetical protein [Rodentibacter heylii]
MAETNICIALDCGATLEIMPIGARFQVLEILGDQIVGMANKKPVRLVACIARFGVRLKKSAVMTWLNMKY